MWDRILSLGIIATDFQLNELERFEVDVWCPPAVLKTMHPTVRGMHTRSGLLDRVSNALSFNTVDGLARELLDRVGATPKNAFLAGSSVHFDRSFLTWNRSVIPSFVSHRMVDVSTLKVLGQRWTDVEAPKGEAKHTPIADLEASIAELRHWQRAMFRDGVGPIHGDSGWSTP